MGDHFTRKALRLRYLSLRHYVVRNPDDKTALRNLRHLARLLEVTNG